MTPSHLRVLNSAADMDKKRTVQLQASHLAYLEQHPYEEFTPEELSAAKRELQKEMEAVKAGMGHGDLSLDAYTQVWEECLAQVSHAASSVKHCIH